MKVVFFPLKAKPLIGLFFSCIRLFVLYCTQFGPLSERYEVTTGPGAPEQCRAPTTTCKSPSCVVVSWEVRPFSTSFPFAATASNEFAHSCINNLTEFSISQAERRCRPFCFSSLSRFVSPAARLQRRPGDGVPSGVGGRRGDHAGVLQRLGAQSRNEGAPSRHQLLLPGAGEQMPLKFESLSGKH